MRRPHWRSAMFTAASGAVGLAILAGCTTSQSNLSATDQTARYLQYARGRYVIPGPAGDPWGPYIREASSRYDVPETWIRALMRQESGGNLYRNGQLITSSAGAMGLMQVMPGTYAELRARHNLGPDPFDPHDNIMAGVGYMREMYDMYGSPGFLAAYNAGPNRLDDYLANQRGLPDETRRYVASIGPSLSYASPRVRSPAEQYVMNQVPLYIPPGPRYGYGTAQLPTVQLAAATPTYRAPVYTAAAVQPTYTPPAQPTAVAWAATPKPANPPAATQQPAALAWAEPPKPVYAQTPTYAPQPQRTVVARAEERDDEDDVPLRRTHSQSHQSAPTRVALAMGRTSPQRSGGGFHLISSAMAAEVYTTRHGKKVYTIPVSYTKPDRTPAHSSGGSGWKLHATGPVQAPPVCHKNSHGKTVCGAEHI
jgi:hypothetical protein